MNTGRMLQEPLDGSSLRRLDAAVWWKESIRERKQPKTVVCSPHPRTRLQIALSPRGDRRAY